MALSAERNTTSRAGDQLAAPVAAAARIWQGSLVCANATGFAVPGSVSATLTALGMAEETVDNLAGADAAKTATIRRGVFLFKNHGADAVAQADQGKDCYVLDDETVAKTSAASTRSRAGKVIGVESAGVWVEIR